MDDTRYSLPEKLAEQKAPIEETATAFTDSPLNSFVSRPVRWLELVVVVLLVVLSDVTIYQSRGLTGPAAFFLLAPILILLGAAVRRWNLQTLVAAILLWGVAARLIWCGNVGAVAVGFVLLGCVAIGIAGGTLFLSDITRFAGGLLISATHGLRDYERFAHSLLGRWGRIPGFAHLLQFVLPPVVGSLFVGIFILANPDAVNWVSEILKSIDRWFVQLVESPWRIVFWIVSCWLSIGLLRPLVRSPRMQSESVLSGEVASEENPFYPAFRNTLTLLIFLFAGYLVFEFRTMWVGEFPEKFYYAGYAHEGAFWLTVALGLTTLLLSAIFRGKIWKDPRLPILRRTAMIWSIENMLLAAAVFNRLFIYINFNGMTRMRVVGMMGTATVVVGLLLVVMKIRRQHSFAWVIRRQLVALALAIYLYVVLPVDAFVIGYNVRQVLAGNPKPSVQIAHHPTSVEGKLMLFPLVSISDPIIRDGVVALLHNTRDELSQSRSQEKNRDWRTYQGAEEMFEIRSRGLPDFPSDADAWEHFRSHSFQWY